MPRLRASIAAAGLLLASCKQPASELPGLDAFGLTEAPGEHPVAASAITLAQNILGPGAHVHLSKGWLGPRNGVPLYTVTGDGMASREVIGTYAECGCVLMTVAGLRTWLATATGSGAGRLDIDEPALIAYMLLHEAGHVAQGRTPCGMTSGAPSNGNTALNLTPTEQKACEVKADAFAAAAIRTALAVHKGPGMLAAGNVAIALSQLSWNLQAHRMLDSFGANAMRDPSLFRDIGLSHPNLEWRILSVNNMIAPSESSSDLLNAFEKARTNGPMTFNFSFQR